MGPSKPEPTSAFSIMILTSHLIRSIPIAYPPERIARARAALDRLLIESPGSADYQRSAEMLAECLEIHYLNPTLLTLVLEDLAEHEPDPGLKRALEEMVAGRPPKESWQPTSPTSRQRHPRRLKARFAGCARRSDASGGSDAPDT